SGLLHDGDQIQIRENEIDFIQTIRTGDRAQAKAEIISGGVVKPIAAVDLSLTAQQVERTCWCGATGASIIGIFNIEGGGDFPLVRCDRCGVLALFPQLSDDELLAAYLADYYGSTRKKFIAPIARIVSVFQRDRARLASRLAPSAARILDVGSGNGGFLVEMKQRGFQCEGTEWTLAAAARVPGNADIQIHVGDLLDLDLPEGSYDLITMWHVFEHLRKPREILDKAKGLLKPDGSLLLSLPNVESRQAKRFGTAW